MKQKFYGYLQCNKTYLAVALSLFCCLFILGYQYIGRINRIEPSPPVKVEKQVTFPTVKEYTSGDALLDIKLNRDRERSLELEQVKELMEQISISDEVKKEAERELWRLNQVTLKENELENLLKANGFYDTLVTVGQHFVTVVVTGHLKVEDAEAVGGMAAEATGFNIEQVRIVEQI